ncbi:MAG: hypothetical protein ABWX94_01755 [Candidatus Saccharimonadales bacterium]
MSLETNQWTELSAPQGQFFAQQLEAAGQVAFSSTAHGAGIIALNAGRYDFEPRANYAQRAIIWPDPHEQNTACIVSQEVQKFQETASFVRITSTNQGYAAEGVVTKLGFDQGANLYGRQLLSERDMPDSYLTQVGTGFMVAAMQRYSEIRRTSPSKAAPGMVGVEGSTVARLFRSLNSLGSNLVVAGAMHEKSNFTTQTYDLASSLLKMTVSGIRGQASETNNILLPGANGVPRGAIFESQDTINAIYRTQDYPDSIALATVARPGMDPTTFVDQYTIQVGLVSLDMMPLPAESYNIPSLAAALSSIKVVPKNAIANIPVRLDAQGVRTLDQRLIRLLSERIDQTV